MTGARGTRARRATSTAGAAASAARSPSSLPLPSPAPRRRVSGQRKLLPLEDWPAADRAAWDGLFRAGDLLDEAGAACHWSPATRRTNLKHYARWLGWCAATGRLGPGDRGVDAGGDGGDGEGSEDGAFGVTPQARATPEAVEAYARALLAEVAPRSAAASLIGLKCVLLKMAPDEDWAWLRQMTARLKAWSRAQPARPLRAPGQSAPQLFAIAVAELERLARLPAPHPRERQAFRDVLLVALLLACPIRERNLAQMELGRHLARVGETWHLRFAPEETKTGQALHLLVPEALTPFLDDYLARIRPASPGAAAHAGVWPAQKGRPMAEETIYATVMATTARLFGTAINPHAFRSLAATLLAETSPEDALHARPLLGHRQPHTTERHYIRASQIEAARKVSKALEAIRDRERG